MKKSGNGQIDKKEDLGNIFIKAFKNVYSDKNLKTNYIDVNREVPIGNTIFRILNFNNEPTTNSIIRPWFEELCKKFSNTRIQDKLGLSMFDEDQKNIIDAVNNQVGLEILNYHEKKEKAAAARALPKPQPIPNPTRETGGKRKKRPKTVKKYRYVKNKTGKKRKKSEKIKIIKKNKNKMKISQAIIKHL